MEFEFQTLPTAVPLAPPLQLDFIAHFIADVSMLLVNYYKQVWSEGGCKIAIQK